MMQHIGDITKIDGATIEPVWCVTGGSPCQDLSIAGKRAGLAGARSGLFMEQIRVIKEMREHDKQLGWAGELIRPRYMVWENVPGALSSNKGRDFAAVLEETIRIVEPEAPGIEVPEKGWPTWGGYRDVDGRWSVAWRVHDAQYWGVPQRRRRIALVADFGGDTAHEILFERAGMSGNLEPRGEAGERPSGNAESGVNPAVARSLTARADGSPGIDRGPNTVVAPVAADLYNATLTGDTAATVTTRTGQYGDASGPSVLCAAFRLGNSEQARSIGYQEELSPTLNAECGGNKPAVVAPAVVLDMTHACDVIRECGKTVPSLQARMGTGGNQVPLIYQMQGFGDYRQADVSSACKQRDYKDSTDLVVGIDEECNAYIEQYGTLRAHASGGAEETLMHRMVVRRLTPLECERLQGFPDGWTDIGDYTDSARYKALGNSIALPFWRWMFGRMAAYLPEGATLGSLFDGIGGFPLCWEDVHGAGTAVWASEIEEFPIAVTKKRFGSENMIHYTLNIEPPVEPPAYTCPICPVCGAETDTVYKNVYGDPVGCPECVTEVDAWTL